MIDSHCHLTHSRLAREVDGVIARARDAGLQACLNIGTGTADARHGLALAARHPGFVFCSAGIDPFTAHDAGERFGDEIDALQDLLRGGGFQALGEVGLDYHHDLDPRPTQAERLERQLDLAVLLDLPVVLHAREAHDDMISILATHPRIRGVVHSFTGGPAEAERYLDLGWHLGFNGVVTFKNADEVRAAARIVPAERLLVETDSPYLAPVPHRGKRCEPGHVAITLRCLARLREEPEAALVETTTRNAVRLFHLSIASDGC